MDYEGELAVVIGKRCKNIQAEEAEKYILGYTCFNDVTARDLQRKDGQWTRAKASIPLRLWPLDRYDRSLHNQIQTRVNGKDRPEINTSDLIFDVPELVEFISGVMTLEPGDVIATGTPPGVGQLQKGNVVEVEIAGIGVLKNSVI